MNDDMLVCWDGVLCHMMLLWSIILVVIHDNMTWLVLCYNIDHFITAHYAVFIVTHTYMMIVYTYQQGAGSLVWSRFIMVQGIHRHVIASNIYRLNVNNASKKLAIIREWCNYTIVSGIRSHSLYHHKRQL